MLDEDGVGAHLLPGGHLQGAARDRLLGALDGVGAAVQAVDALEDVAELAVAELAHLVELLVVAGDEALSQGQALVDARRRLCVLGGGGRRRRRFCGRLG